MNPYEAPQTTNIRSAPDEDWPRVERNLAAVKKWTLYYSAALLVLNIIILLVAIAAGGWDALFILLFGGPGLNLVAGIVGLALIPRVKSQAGSTSLALYIAAVVILPIAAIILNLLIIKLG